MLVQQRLHGREEGPLAIALPQQPQPQVFHIAIPGIARGDRADLRGCGRRASHIDEPVRQAQLGLLDVGDFDELLAVEVDGHGRLHDRAAGRFGFFMAIGCISRAGGVAQQGEQHAECAAEVVRRFHGA